jgi:hypothetical protein
VGETLTLGRLEPSFKLLRQSDRKFSVDMLLVDGAIVCDGLILWLVICCGECCLYWERGKWL